MHRTVSPGITGSSPVGVATLYRKVVLLDIRCRMLCAAIVLSGTAERRKVHKYGSLAQLEEHAAVNCRGVGSSPTGAARDTTERRGGGLAYLRRSDKQKRNIGE